MQVSRQDYFVMPFLSHPFAVTPRRRCRTIDWPMVSLVVAVMMFALLLIGHGLEPAAAVALSVALLGGAQRVLAGTSRAGGQR
jgi:hypothetical protein